MSEDLYYPRSAKRARVSEEKRQKRRSEPIPDAEPPRKYRHSTIGFGVEVVDHNNAENDQGAMAIKAAETKKDILSHINRATNEIVDSVENLIDIFREIRLPDKPSAPNDTDPELPDQDLDNMVSRIVKYSRQIGDRELFANAFLI